MTTNRAIMSQREGAVYRFVNRRVIAGLDISRALDIGCEIAEFMLMAELIDDVAYNHIIDEMESMMASYTCIAKEE